VRVEYAFEARGERPPVKVVWYDGDRLPKEIHGQEVPGFGVCFVGDDGMLWSDYGRHQLFPTDKFANYKRPPQSIPKSVGHHQEWINACKTGSLTSCPFSYSGRLTETVLLGVVAYRSGDRLAWDAEKMTTGSSKADGLLEREYRKGWKL
jgi:hypothetical protein